MIAARKRTWWWCRTSQRSSEVHFRRSRDFGRSTFGAVLANRKWEDLPIFLYLLSSFEVPLYNTRCTALSCRRDQSARGLYVMAAIGSLVFCTDCGNLLDGSTGNEKAILNCDVCGTENKGAK